jgi:serine/threonine-protein kinase
VAPGKQEFEKSVEVPSSSAEHLKIDLPTLADASSAPPIAPNQAERSSADGQTTVNGPSTHAPTARTLGFVAGGLGLVSVGVGSYFGLKAFSRWNARNQACESGCTAEAKTAGDEAESAATVSTVGFAAGAASLGVGLVLILTSSSAKEPQAPSARVGRLQVGLLTSRDGAGLSLGSKW